MPISSIIKRLFGAQPEPAKPRTEASSARQWISNPWHAVSVIPCRDACACGATSESGAILIERGAGFTAAGLQRAQLRLPLSASSRSAQYSAAPVGSHGLQAALERKGAPRRHGPARYRPALSAVVVAVPGDEIAHPHLDRRGGL